MFRFKSIKPLLSKEGYTVRDLVKEILDLADSTIYKYTRGEGNPTLAALNILAEGLSKLLQRPIYINDLVETIDEDQPVNIAPDKLSELELQNADNYEIIKAVSNVIRKNLDDVKMPVSVSNLPAVIKTASATQKSKKFKFLALALWALLMISGGIAGVFLQNRYGFLESSPPPVPKLLFPSRNVITKNLELVVEKTRNAKGYDFYLKNADNNLVLIEADDFENHKSTKLAVPPILCRGGNYAWTARARNGGNTSSWASAMSFSYNPPAELKDIPNVSEYPKLPKEPTPLEPQGTVTSKNLTLRLAKSDDAVVYGFYMRDLTTGELVVYAPYVKKPSYKVDPELIIDGHSYRWNANSINCTGFSEISRLAFFDVKLP